MQPGMVFTIGTWLALCAWARGVCACGLTVPLVRACGRTDPDARLDRVGHVGRWLDRGVARWRALSTVRTHGSHHRRRR